MLVLSVLHLLKIPFILSLKNTTYDAPSLEYEKFHRPTGKDPVYDRKIKFPFRDYPTDYQPNVERPDYYEEGYTGPALSREARKILKAYEERVSVLVLSNLNFTSSVAECGVRRSFYGRISTGKEVDLGLAKYGEFPWQAAILLKVEEKGYRKIAYKFICGATVISPKLLLTAAHCVKGMKINNLKVKLGEWNLKGYQGEMFPTLERNIEKVIIHDYYRSSTFSHDLAIIVLNRAVNLRRTPHISQICMPPRHTKFDEYTKCYIVGWGNDVYKPNYGSNILKVASVSFMKEDCKHKLKKSISSLANNLLKEDISCVVGAHGKDACVGDGGGAVICPLSNDEVPVCRRGYSCEEEHYFIAGVVSWGSNECGQADSVTVVTDLVSHNDWVSDKIRKYGGSRKPFDDQYGHVDDFDDYPKFKDDYYEDPYERDFGYNYQDRKKGFYEIKK
ncbi:Plasma kallikrein [Armadillidium nasatum]|uniref:Plasma kallikrein n=1 Tax=Armadillidium nasatum TaxID=96803 RepID=A0A5N5SKM6_9CRUS|nr:Plasma kallikrein [Armadillidium nasatum]